jgi:hypothetical protein
MRKFASPSRRNLGRPSIPLSVQEAEEFVIYYAWVVYRFGPQYEPALDYAEKLLEEARAGDAVERAKRILDRECLRFGCPSISSLSDLEKLEERLGAETGLACFKRKRKPDRKLRRPKQ